MPFNTRAITLSLVECVHDPPWVRVKGAHWTDLVDSGGGEWRGRRPCLTTLPRDIFIGKSEQ